MKYVALFFILFSISAAFASHKLIPEDPVNHFIYWRHLPPELKISVFQQCPKSMQKVLRLLNTESRYLVDRFERPLNFQTIKITRSNKKRMSRSLDFLNNHLQPSHANVIFHATRLFDFLDQLNKIPSLRDVTFNWSVDSRFDIKTLIKKFKRMNYIKQASVNYMDLYYYFICPESLNTSYTLKNEWTNAKILRVWLPKLDKGEDYTELAIFKMLPPELVTLNIHLNQETTFADRDKLINTLIAQKIQNNPHLLTIKLFHENMDTYIHKFPKDT